MATNWIVNGVTYGAIIFVSFYALWYGWNHFGFNKVYYSLMSGKKRRAVKHDILTNNYDSLKGDSKIEAYLKNPIISNTNPEIITQAEIEIENEKPIIAMQNFIRGELAKSEFPDSPLVYETIKLALLKQGFKESFIRRTIKKIQKEIKNDTRQIWGKPSPSASREAPRVDAGASASTPIGSNLGGFAKPGNIPAGTLETLGTAQQLDDRASPSPQRKSKYFD